jgi:hypothetical protein
VSGLDEQKDYYTCPHCGREPRGYYLTNKNRRFIGAYKKERKYNSTTGEYDKPTPKVSINRWFPYYTSVLMEPELYIERARCVDCWSLFSKWRNKDKFEAILIRVVRMIRREENVEKRTMWRETEPVDAFYL